MDSGAHEGRRRTALVSDGPLEIAGSRERRAHKGPQSPGVAEDRA